MCVCVCVCVNISDTVIKSCLNINEAIYQVYATEENFTRFCASTKTRVNILCTHFPQTPNDFEPLRLLCYNKIAILNSRSRFVYSGSKQPLKQFRLRSTGSIRRNILAYVVQ